MQNPPSPKISAVNPFDSSSRARILEESGGVKAIDGVNSELCDEELPFDWYAPSKSTGLSPFSAVHKSTTIIFPNLNTFYF